MSSSDLGKFLAAHIEYEDSNHKGGNRGFTCLYCEIRYFGSQSRVLAHLLGHKGKGIAVCKKISVEDKAAIQEAYDCDGKGGAEVDPRSSSRAASDEGAGSAAEDAPRKRHKQQELPPMMLNATKADRDDAVADFFYGTGIPLHHSRNPMFKNMLKLISQTRGGVYTGPAYNALREGLLDRAKGRIKKLLEPYFEHGRLVTGFVSLCDGWTDVQGRPLLNFCLATPKGVHFLYAVDTSGHDKEGQFIFERLAEVCEEIGSAHDERGSREITEGARHHRGY